MSESYAMTFHNVPEHQVLERAAEILKNRWGERPVFLSSQATQGFLRMKLSAYDHEVFAVLFLDSKHRLLDYREMFHGTLDGAAVYPREVAKAALTLNAGAVIFGHNHPSGDSTPSHADRQITRLLVDALKLIDVRVLDHVIVGDNCLSFAEQNLL